MASIEPKDEERGAERKKEERVAERKDQEKGQEKGQEKATLNGKQTAEPDVLLDVPLVKVDEISLDVDDLTARVSLSAKVGNLVSLEVGAEAHLGHLKLTIKGVEAKALLKVRLDHVQAILSRTLDTIDHNPEILTKLIEPVGQAVGSVGKTVEQTVPQLGQTLGETVKQTVPQAGKSRAKRLSRSGANAVRRAARRLLPGARR